MTKKERQDTVAHLLAGKLYLEEFGWQQGSFGGYVDGKCGPACAWGALSPYRAWEGIPGTRNLSCIGSAYQALTAATENNIPYFNDHPKRTKAQVLAAFDRAIASLE